MENHIKEQNKDSARFAQGLVVGFVISQLLQKRQITKMVKSGKVLLVVTKCVK